MDNQKPIIETYLATYKGHSIRIKKAVAGGGYYLNIWKELERVHYYFSTSFDELIDNSVDWVDSIVMRWCTTVEYSGGETRTLYHEELAEVQNWIEDGPDFTTITSINTIYNRE